MFKKGKLWVADWSVTRAERHRKGFATKTQATKFEAKMRKEILETKKSQASRKSPRSPRRGQRHRATGATTASQRARTRRKRATPASGTSARITAMRSSHAGGKRSRRPRLSQSVSL